MNKNMKNNFIVDSNSKYKNRKKESLKKILHFVLLLDYPKVLWVLNLVQPVINQFLLVGLAGVQSRNWQSVKVF